MIKNTIIIILLIATFILGKAVVELENYHYASMLTEAGFTPCAKISNSNTRHSCLHEYESRTSAWGHLFFALVEKHY